MARIRSVKPELFRHEELFDLEETTKLPVRLAFIGLWTCCDRDGRFKWRVRSLKNEILPYDNVDFSSVLDALASRRFCVKYSVGNEEFGYVPSWNVHQFVNNRERVSQIPEPPLNEGSDAILTRAARVPVSLIADAVKERKGKELMREERVHPWVDIWNENCGPLPKIKKFTPALYASTLTANKIFSDEDFLRAVQILSTKPFPSGENDREWKATFPWILRPKTSKNEDSSLGRVLNGLWGDVAAKNSYREVDAEDDFNNWQQKAGIQ